MRCTSRAISPKMRRAPPPPAPSTIALSKPRSQPGVAASRLARKPSTSELVERSSRPRTTAYWRRRPRARVRPASRAASAASLVRHGDVGADIAARAQDFDEIGELGRRHRLAPVFGVDVVLLDPVIVDQRRARMLDRPADDTCRLARFVHCSATTVLRKMPISGTSISTTSPGLSHSGSPLDRPSLAGVPVTITSPGRKVMKVLA